MKTKIQDFLDQNGSFVLDGALATELERHGCSLDDHLWSARLLIDQPGLIEQLHTAYLAAGADCIITATYQASIPGFTAAGLSNEDARKMLVFAVDLASNARKAFWKDNKTPNRLKPLVAASIGPYGAFLANGAEYTGDYGLTTADLVRWHQPRWEILAGSQADLLACETIPSQAEARAYIELLSMYPKETWLTFSCRDEGHISDGTPLGEVIREVEKSPWVSAVGINCTAPHFLPSLINEAHTATAKPILVYPNSGERYDPVTKAWTGRSDAEQFGTAAREWRKLGAAGIGGCCRTTPAHIKAISRRLKGETAS